MHNVEIHQSKENEQSTVMHTDISDLHAQNVEQQNLSTKEHILYSLFQSSKALKTVPEVYRVFPAVRGSIKD